MDLTIAEAAELLNMSEDAVLNLIASGGLAANVQGSKPTIPDSAIQGLIELKAQASESQAEQTHADPLPLVQFNAFRIVLDRLADLSEKIDRGSQDREENQRLLTELRWKDQELFEKDLEIDKLNRELVYLKYLGEKEIEVHERNLRTKCDLIEKQAVERIARERDHMEKRLLDERKIWSEKLAQEQERFARDLAEAKYKESFWHKLMKLLTWSQ